MGPGGHERQRDRGSDAVSKTSANGLARGSAEDARHTYKRGAQCQPCLKPSIALNTSIDKHQASGIKELNTGPIADNGKAHLTRFEFLQLAAELVIADTPRAGVQLGAVLAPHNGQVTLSQLL